MQRLLSLATRPTYGRVVVSRLAAFSTAGGGDSITYSGGHASTGQGGYYASGGVKAEETDTPRSDRHSVLAVAADVQRIAAVMKELETLEGILERETDATTGRSIEIKASIKKLMTQPVVMESLDRLEVEGEPVWGLSSEEREMIVLAREKVNDC